MFHLDVSAFLATLPIMGYGMAGIFLVIGVIMAAVWLMGKTLPPKKDE